MKYVYVIIYDLLFFIPAYFGLTFWSSTLVAAYSKIGPSIATIQTVKAIAGVQQSGQFIQSFLRSSIVYTILAIILLFFLWSLSRSLIWTTIQNKRFTFKFYKKFSLLNLIWIPVSFVLHVILFVLGTIIFYVIVRLPSDIMTGTVHNSVNLAYMHIVSIFIFLPFVFYIFNLGSYLYIFFTEKPKINQSFQKMTNFVISKIAQLYKPYVFMSVVFVVVSWLSVLFRLFGQTVQIIATVLLSLMFFTWHKFYISQLTKI